MNEPMGSLSASLTFAASLRRGRGPSMGWRLVGLRWSPLIGVSQRSPALRWSPGPRAWEEGPPRAAAPPVGQAHRADPPAAPPPAPASASLPWDADPVAAEAPDEGARRTRSEE